ncbi:putative glutathione S-transferase parC [Ananas comosus]|uniref:glutathione transferase n=1 Tax=Ananas comosus TaxID=4615 RepID=A0A199VR14_ANACO|nr:putative glutathione S-transferase parC [Ananas comosus]
MLGELVCVDYWANGFGMRVRIALREKLVEFEFKEEDLWVTQRSQLVLEMNPIYRSVPILIHHGRPVCGSVNIIEYIDEVWRVDRSSLLPQDPYGRAQARFWADFIDKKSKGEDKEAAKADLIEDLKRLEEVLGERKYFGGDKFNFLDIALIPVSSMFNGYEEHGGFKIEDHCPNLVKWVERCMERESVSKTLPNHKEMYELHKKWYGIE